MDERKLADPPAPIPPSRRPRISLARSFYFAFVGLFYLFRTQRNARIELLIGLLACALAWWLGISGAEWAILVVMIALVLILEALNTAIEVIVDLASPQIHPLAKVAKDVSAATVLLAAIASIVVGLLILGPPLVARLKLVPSAVSPEHTSAGLRSSWRAGNISILPRPSAIDSGSRNSAQRVRVPGCSDVDVLKNTDPVLNAILCELQQNPHPHPLPEYRERE